MAAQEKHFSVTAESPSEEPRVDTFVNDGDHPYSKVSNCLTSTFQNLPKSDKRTKLNKTTSKIIRKESKMKSILKNTSGENSAKLDVTERKQRIVGYCNGDPVYMPEAWNGKSLHVKNIKYLMHPKWNS